MSLSSSALASHFLLILVLQLTCVANYRTPLQQTAKQDADWGEIEKLYRRGWTQREQLKFRESEKTFRTAVKKLTRYRLDYIKDSRSLSFVRASYLLGTFSELANMDQEALDFYLQALESGSGNSTREAAEIHLLSVETANRIRIVKNRHEKPQRAKDYPRISISGGSKGIKDLPAHEPLYQPNE